MKNYIWLLIALLFLCAQIEAQTVNLSLNSNTPQYINTANNTPIKPTVSAPVQVKQTPAHMTTKGTKKEVGEGLDFLDAYFKKEIKVINDTAFNITIDTVVSKSVIIAENEAAKSKQSKVVMHPDSFDFKNTKMTVKFENGQFIAVSPQSEGKQVAKVFGVEIEDDEPDSIIFEKGILWKGEYFKPIKDTDLDDHYRKPKRVKKVHEPSYVRITERVPDTVDEFLDEYDDDIRREAKAAGIPYAIKAGQILTEASVSGKMSRMATQINNLGGIKCPSNCSLGEGHHGIYKDDTDHDKFRRFATPLMFFKYHSQFLQNNERYNRCFECGEDIECWLLRLQQSGYATHKAYDKLIASVINYYRLSESPIRYNRAATIKRLNIKF